MFLSATSYFLFWMSFEKTPWMVVFEIKNVFWKQKLVCSRVKCNLYFTYI